MRLATVQVIKDEYSDTVWSENGGGSKFKRLEMVVLKGYSEVVWGCEMKTQVGRPGEGWLWWSILTVSVVYSADKVFHRRNTCMDKQEKDTLTYTHTHTITTKNNNRKTQQQPQNKKKTKSATTTVPKPSFVVDKSICYFLHNYREGRQSMLGMQFHANQKYGIEKDIAWIHLISPTSGLCKDSWSMTLVVTIVWTMDSLKHFPSSHCSNHHRTLSSRDCLPSWFIQ